MIVGNEKATDAVAAIIEHKQTNGVPGDQGGRMRGSEAVIITGGKESYFNSTFEKILTKKIRFCPDH